MKIPTALAALATSKPEQSLEQASQQPDKIWLTVPEAAALLKIRPNAVVKRILKGTLEGKRSEDMPFTADGHENFVVLLTSLPERLQYQYHVSRFSRLSRLDEHGSQASYNVSVDLVSPRSVFGDRWIEQFINVAQLLRDITKIREIYQGTGKIKEQLIKLAQSYKISLSTLYRFSAQHQSRELSLLYTDPTYLQYKLPKTMCLWSCDLAFALYLAKEKHYSQNDIFNELKNHSQTPCNACPYSPKSPKSPENPNNPELKADFADVTGVVCTRSKGTMIIPKNRKAINRLLAHIPSALQCLTKEGYRQWRSKHRQTKTLRKTLTQPISFISIRA